MLNQKNNLNFSSYESTKVSLIEDSADQNIITWFQDTDHPLSSSIQPKSIKGIWATQDTNYSKISFGDSCETRFLSHFEKWCDSLAKATLDLRKSQFSSNPLTTLANSDASHLWQHLISQFIDVVTSYHEIQETCPSAQDISTESTRRFMVILPLIVDYNPSLHIDSTNGCINIDFVTRDNSVLSTQISETGKVYYSYVGENKQIFKITGTAKFKDFKDFIKFNKILKMI